MSDASRKISEFRSWYIKNDPGSKILNDLPKSVMWTFMKRLDQERHFVAQREIFNALNTKVTPRWFSGGYRVSHGRTVSGVIPAQAETLRF